jgi:hypothetical protein
MAKADHFTDGHGIRIVFVNGGVTVYEKNVTPGGIEGGDPIDITTNDNTSLRSFAPRTLATETPINLEVTYNQTDKAALEALANTSDDIRTEYPDNTTELTSGWIRSVIANQATSGEQPTANLVVERQGEAPV